MATRAPSRTNLCAMAAPMPRELPVTNATLPSNKRPIRLSSYLARLEDHQRYDGHVGNGKDGKHEDNRTPRNACSFRARPLRAELPRSEERCLSTECDGDQPIGDQQP